MSSLVILGGVPKLISMSNQISAFFRSYPHEVAVSGIADHISKFWDRKMRTSILDHLETGGQGLDPLVSEALGRVKR